MKIKIFSNQCDIYVLFKKLRILLLTLVFLLTSVPQIWAHDSYSKKTGLSPGVNHQSIFEVPVVTENQPEFYFLYNEKLIDFNREASDSVKNQKISEISDEHNSGPDVDNSLADNKIIQAPLFSSEDDQQNAVSGIVTNETGEPLPGVTVVIKGTNQGTVTNANGEYTLTNVSEDAILQFSFIGLKTQEIEIGNQTEINVNMILDAIGIEEVIAIGYGTMKKSDVTGSIATVNEKDFDDQPVVRISEALHGRVPGLMVTNNSGAPGGIVKIRIRGANSLLGSNDPLIVIDGIALNISLSDINVNDISSIEILKDASATAIYGSRGANGVILITTKSGKSVEPIVNININSGISQIAKKYDLLDAGTFSELVNVYRPGTFTPEEIVEFKNTGGVDWQDEIFQTGISNDLQADVSGAAGNTNYFASGNYLDQKGIILRSEFKKYSFRTKFDSQINDKVSVSLNLYAAQLNGLNNRDRGSKGNPVYGALIYSPTFSIYTREGDWNRQDNLSSPNTQNPVMILNERNDEYQSNTYTINSKVNYKILREITLDVVFGSNFNSTNSAGFQNLYINPSQTSANQREDKTKTWQISNILNYNKTFKEIHNLNLTGVFEQSKFEYRGFNANGTNVNPISVEYNNLGIAGGQSIGSYKSETSLRSYLGRFSYTLMDRYLLTATYRADGTSKFQGDNKWGYFPSAALAWRLSEESFLKNSSVISNLKLRSSWGLTGNQGIDAYATISRIATTYTTYSHNASYAGSTVQGVDNPDLKWESTEQINFGVDIGILSNKLNISADYFHKTTHDLLHNVSIPDYDGGGNINKNIGEMENKGIEMAIDAVPVQNNNMLWEISFNITSYKNKLLRMAQDSFMLGYNYAPGLTQESPFALKVGESLSSFWGYEWLGIYQSDEAALAQSYGFQPGDNKYADINNDKIIDSKDKKIIGNALPDFTWGLNNSINYKNAGMNFFVQGVHGMDVLNISHAITATLLADAITITLEEGADFWAPDNEDARWPNPASSTGKNFIESTQYLQNGSYVRLKNLSLYYNFKTIPGFSNIRVTLSGQNLLTFTKYEGYDPEATTSGNTDINGGIDVGAFPASRSYTLGIRVTF